MHACTADRCCTSKQQVGTPRVPLSSSLGRRVAPRVGRCFLLPLAPHTLLGKHTSTMSDPVVVAMGDDKLKDSHGQDENPEVAQEEAKEASHTGTTEDGGEAAMEDVDTSSADKRASQDVSPGLISRLTYRRQRHHPCSSRNTYRPTRLMSFTAPIPPPHPSSPLFAPSSLN